MDGHLPVISVLYDPAIDVPNLEPQLVLDFTLVEDDQVLLLIYELLVGLALLNVLRRVKRGAVFLVYLCGLGAPISCVFVQLQPRDLLDFSHKNVSNIVCFIVLDPPYPLLEYVFNGVDFVSGIVLVIKALHFFVYLGLVVGVLLLFLLALVNR